MVVSEEEIGPGEGDSEDFEVGDRMAGKMEDRMADRMVDRTADREPDKAVMQPERSVMLRVVARC